MSWAERVSNGSIRFYEAIRSGQAGDAARREAGGTLQVLDGHRYALVVTYRRSGEPVPTPVWFGLAGGRLYFRSVATGAKLGRIREHPGVVVAPCTANGRPTGPSVRGEATLLAPAEEAMAERAIRTNYGLSRRLYMRFVGARVPGTYVEIRPVPDL